MKNIKYNMKTDMIASNRDTGSFYSYIILVGVETASKPGQHSLKNKLDLDYLECPTEDQRTLLLPLQN